MASPSRIRSASPRARWWYERVRHGLHLRTYRRWRRLARGLPPSPLRVDERRGWALFEPGTLPAAGAAVDRARELFALRDADPTLIPAKSGYLRKVALDPDDLQLGAPFLRLALDEQLVACAAAYLGVLPVLSNVWLWHSPNDRWGPDRARGSQDFHLDYEDSRQLKAFLFVEDVTEESGPLTVVDAAHSAALLRRRRYRLGSTLPDAEVYAHAPPAAVTPLCGPSGSVALVDTSRCLHLGSRPGTRPRLVWGAQFVSPLSVRFPLDWPKGDLRHAARPGAPTLVNHVLGDPHGGAS